MNFENWQLKYFTIWGGQAISLVTSAVLQMAIIWYLTERTESAMILSMATLVGFLPQALFGAFIGVWVDRWNRKWTMIVSDMLIASAAGVLAVVALTGDLPIWLIFVILFIRSVGTAFHTPALQAITPLLVPEENLVKCAGYTQSLQSISLIISPALAGLLYASFGLQWIFYLDIIGTIFASLAVAAVVIPNLPNTEEQQVLQEMREGFLALKNEKALYALLWVCAVYSFLYMPISALFPLMSLSYFNGTITSAAVVEVVFAIGMLVGGILLGVTGGFKKRVWSFTFSLALMGGALIISGVLPESSFMYFAVMCSLMGLSAPFFNGIYMALIQEKIAPEYLGRVFSLLGSVFSLAMPLGLVLSALFADDIGVERYFYLSGIGILVLAIFCALHPKIKIL
ncbi:MFS transporter [Lysinibacillus sp. NPDC097287]|uniref:MFS transporter n=1 Tax=Lysinibacillus sp. NPDC097287 TaxID=3364144 RepID=UPI0038197473